MTYQKDPINEICKREAKKLLEKAYGFAGVAESENKTVIHTTNFAGNELRITFEILQ